jgi:hypothetical protein
MGRQRRRLDSCAQVEADAGEIYDREILRREDILSRNQVVSPKERTYLRRVSWPSRPEDREELEAAIRESLEGFTFFDISLCDTDKEGKSILVYARYLSPAAPEQEADDTAA